MSRKNQRLLENMNSLLFDLDFSDFIALLEENERLASEIKSLNKELSNFKKEFTSFKDELLKKNDDENEVNDEASENTDVDKRNKELLDDMYKQYFADPEVFPHRRKNIQKEGD